ncbi:glycosyltransferase [Chitinivorax sp. PXF-14]|uniref:glycosyltransferase n=1 Tax=Chitinivorax sp. PXF-14 TaxID=3230488 RepID=UPI003467A94A
MKKTALIYALWEKNLPALTRYLAGKPRVILIPDYLASKTVVDAIVAAGSEARLLPMQGLASDAGFAAPLLAQLEGPVGASLCEVAGLPAGALAVLSSEAGRDLPVVYQWLSLLEQAMLEYDIEITLVNEDVLRDSKLLALWSRRHEIPILQVAHGTGLGRDYIGEDNHSDDIAVFSRRSAEFFIDLGVAPQRLHPIGNPAWDAYPELLRQRDSVRQQLAAQHGIDPKARWLVFGTSWNAYLSALDQRDFGEQADMACRALAELLRGGVSDTLLIIKDRVVGDTPDVRRQRLAGIAHRHGVSEQVHYAMDDARNWVAAADVMISLDSNLSIEAILADVPAVNLVSDFGAIAGGGFGADDGVLSVEPGELGAALGKLIGDPAYRQALLEQARSRRDYFNQGNDGRAAERLAVLIEQKARHVAVQSAQQYVWQQYLDVEEIDATAYHGGARADLVEMFSNNPKIVLDIGCAAGGTGELLKRKYPKCQVWGVETNRAAAKVAAERLDRVLVGKFEEFDLEREGIAKGTLDGVILADVLEHMYNPWAVMVALQPYLSITAQVIISIPNVRNLKLMEDLAAGFWRYDAAGLLDITHIRFFTLKEFRRFLHETGYHVNSLRYGIDQRLAAFFQANKQHDKLNVELGRMTLADVGKDELMELCSLQFYINAGVGALNDDIRPYHANNPYIEYLQRCRLQEAEARQYDKLLAEWTDRAKVAVAIYLPQGADDRLTATVKSLGAQLYQEISLWVLSPLPAPQGVPLGDRFHWLQVNGALSGGLRVVAQQSDADWLAWLTAGDQLEPQALLQLVENIRRHPEWQFIYTDEDMIVADGESGQPVFKPDFDPQYLLSSPYLGGLCAVRRSSLLALVTAELAGAEHVELALQCWQQWGKTAVGHLPAVLYHRHPEGWQPLADQLAAAHRAGNRALARTGLPATLEAGWNAASFRWHWQGQRPGMVSLLIAVRDDLPRLQRCIEGLLAHTGYPEFEILLLDNGSNDSAALAFLQGLDAMGDPRIRVFRYEARASLPELHNLLAREARGQVLGFMHFDCLPLDGEWLDKLLGELQRPGVAAVAPRLLNGQGKIHGGGLILGIDGGYAPAFAGLSHDDAGPLGRAHVAQSFSALSGGMLLIRREQFEQLGGFAPGYGVAAEVDLGLRLGEAGLSLLWTPYVSMMCEGIAGSLDWAETGRQLPADRVGLDDNAAGIEPLLERWLPKFARDPAYNPNLASVGQPFVQEHRPVLQRQPLGWKPLPRVLVHPADTTGCGFYRMLQPADMMKRLNLAETLVGFDLLHPSDRLRLAPDSIVFQRQIYENQVKRMRDTRKILKPFMVYELDDLITNVPVKSLHRGEIPADTVRWLREAIGLCDRFIVSTEPLAHAMRGYNDDIRVVPNRIDGDRWRSLKVPRAQGKKPRVGWAGSVSHSGDLELIVDVVKELADEVDWVFLGMCPEFLRPYVCEFLPGVPVDQYPAKLASLGLDLALAPLELNAFNESKSNLKLLEYGVLGYPVICTDIVPYQCDLPVTRVKNRFRDWVGAIREHLADRNALAQRGMVLKQAVEHSWLLEDHCADWLKAWLP